LTSTTATTTANITAGVVIATLTAAPKPYDGTLAAPNASLGCTVSGVLAADLGNVVCTATGGSFDSGNVGTRTVIATVTISGSAAGGYTLGAPGTLQASTTASASSSIITRPVTAAGTATEPDANMTCVVTGGLIGSDIACTATNGVFSSASVGAGSVTATVTLVGAQAGNYTLGAAGTTVSFLTGVPASAGVAAADIVYGQLGSFLTNTPNNGGISAHSLSQPYQVVADSSGGTYIVDSQNSRVLFFAAGSTTATRVYGQGGSFVSATANSGGLSANSLSNPTSAALDAGGNLYVTDAGNNRVLFYLAGSTTATRVYGQNGDFATGAANTGGVTATSLSSPSSVAVDPGGNVYVADQGNNRVLFFAGASTTATRVYGQNGNFTGTFSGLAANFLSAPGNLVVDGSGNLYVSDMVNNRVLFFSGGSTTATRVYGQNGDFLTNGFGTSATQLRFPRAAAIDGDDNLYIADQQNHRVLFFPAGSTTATRVYGQHGSFTTNTPNNGGVGPASLSNPISVSIGGDGSLAISDLGNHRVLRFATTVSGRITAMQLTATLTAADKVYDGTTTAPDAGMSCTLTGVAPADLGNVTCTATSGAFSSAGIGSRTVTAIVTIGGPAAGNYTLASVGTTAMSTTATATASITAKPVTAVITAAPKTYDGNGNATIQSCSLIGVVAPDTTSCVVSANAADNQFSSPNAGNAIVTAANLTLANNASGAYTLASTTAATTAVIDRRSVTATLTALGKTFDGTATEPDVNMHCVLTGVLAGDAVSCTPSNGAFNGASVGATSVTATVTLGGTHAANYTFGGPGTATSSQVLTATGALNASTTAAVVYGQFGNFTTNTANNGGLGAASIAQPYHVVADTTGGLYVADYQNNRVLFFPSGSSTAARVYGQGGSFASGTSNLGGVSATSLSGPSALALDAGGNLYIADNSNNRVLFYPAGSTTATRVYGQGGAFTTNAQNNGGSGANNLSSPSGVAVDAGGNVYIADTGNSRVQFYAGTSTTATRTYGFGFPFTSAGGLNGPTSIAVDAGGNLYVGDSANNRVLYFPSGSTTATRVYGQGGAFNTSTANNGGISATSLRFPRIGGLDANGNLYVADQQNHRVLFFPAGSTTATRVYGQAGNFTTATSNNGGVGADSLSMPVGVAIGNGGMLYVAELNNNRVLRFPTTGSGAIVTAPLTATITAANKPYDGTATAPDAALSCTLTGVPPADAANVGCVATGGSFGTATVGLKTVTATVSLTGAAAENYTLASTSATATASITTAPLMVNVVAAGKAYDRTTAAPDASLSCTVTGVVPADVANILCTATGGTFDSADAGARTVTVTIAIGGTAVSNYTLGAAGTSTTTASRSTASTITTLAVTGALTAVSKGYDGTATEPDANMTCALTGVLAGDTVTCTATNGAFNGATVGSGSVTATATLGGAQGGNYTFGAAGSTMPSMSLAAAGARPPRPSTASSAVSPPARPTRVG
jgi:hypothetical protein